MALSGINKVTGGVAIRGLCITIIITENFKETVYLIESNYKIILFHSGWIN